MKRTKCKTCNFCKKLYSQWRYLFWAQKLFYCEVRDELTDLGGTCNSWRKKRDEYDLSAKRFDGAERDIKLLLQYLGDG